MRKYTMKDWLAGKVSVLAETEVEFDAMMDFAEKNGLRWATGHEAKEYRPLKREPVILTVLGFFPEKMRLFYRYKSQTIGNPCPIISVKNLLPDVTSYALHITSAGATTHAVLKENGKVTKRSKAVCNPDDKYDFLTGARAAFDRMQGKKPLSLEDVPTEKLVEELAKRENVRREMFERKENIIVSMVSKSRATAFDVIGPAELMMVFDKEGKSK